MKYNENDTTENRLIKKITALLIAVMICPVIISQTGCAAKHEPVSDEGFYFDTVCRISIYDMDEKKAKSLIEDAFKLCAGYDDLFSKTKKDSEIYRINHASGKSVSCSKDTVKCIALGLRYGRLSAGKFDITIGTVSDLWNFHHNKSTLPPKNKIDEALKRVGYRQVRIDKDSVTAIKGGEIDLGGIGKGYVADKILEYLSGKGVKSAVIDLGGNIEVLGDKEGKPFDIGIEKPYSDMSEIIGSVEAKDMSLVTSGVYERYFEYKGKKYHHILDPATGYPAETDVVGVTILAKSGKSAESDALATTCLLIGEKKSMALIEKMPGYEALFIDKSGKIKITDGFDLKEQ